MGRPVSLYHRVPVRPNLQMLFTRRCFIVQRWPPPPPPTHVIRQTTLLHRVVVHGRPLFWERGISNEMKRISIVSVFVRRIRFAMSFLFSFAIKLKFFLIQRQREPIGGPIESEGSSGNNLLMASDAKL